MSQAGIINIQDSILPPDVPLIFVGNVGFGSAIANTFDIVGTGIISTSVSGNVLTISSSGSGFAATLTGNSGFATAVGSNINVIGSTATGISSSGSSDTLTFSLSSIPNSSLAHSLVTLNSGNNITVTGGGPLSLGGVASFNLTGTTNHTVQVGNASGSLTSIANGTTGQVLTATTGADPSWSSIVTGVSSVTGTANQILASPTTGAVVLSLIGPYTPSTYTAHSVLVGEGTSSIVGVGPTANTGAILQNNSGADPTYSTATYPSTTTVSQILYSSSTNVISGLSTANKAVLTTGATGIPVLTTLSTDGQFIIGSTAGVPAAGNITSTGGTVIVTNGSNNINLEIVPQTNSFARIMLMMGG